MRINRHWLGRIVLALILVLTLMSVAFAAGEGGSRPMVDCPDCGGYGICMECYGTDPACSACEGTNVCATCGGEGQVPAASNFYSTAFALLPPVIAIALALITKEVYSSLFIGILVGGLLYSNFSFEGTVLHVFEDGIASVLSDSYNVGILIFLVILGSMVCLMNKAGGSAAFGRWASQNIKSRVGAQLAAILLGVLIFIDDYFNCLTVGSVMRPITDKHNVSRVKLAYLIDATAAPVCIIAPISSWAAAVSGFVEDGQGLALFIKAIPYNFYALLTIVMMIAMVVMKVEFGPMLKYERNAIKTGDLFSGSNPYAGLIEEDADDSKGKVIDLVLPIIVLVICCVIGMIYSGGFFSGASFVDSFSGSDASVGLMLGSAFGLIFTLIFYAIRRAMSFRDMMGCIPEGFKAMVPAIMILTFAWSLKAMTDSLGATAFVEYVVNEYAKDFALFLPAIAGLCHRHQLGHLRHPDPHHPGHLPPGRPHGRGVRVRLHGRRRVRRPLLPHLRHHHHGLGGRSVRPRQPRVHPAALCHCLCLHCLHQLHRGRPAHPLRRSRPAGSAHRHRAGAGLPAVHALPRRRCGGLSLISSLQEKRTHPSGWVLFLWVSRGTAPERGRWAGAFSPLPPSSHARPGPEAPGWRSRWRGWRWRCNTAGPA